MNTTATSTQSIATDTMELVWCPESRLALVRYAPDVTLTRSDGVVLVDALTGWIAGSSAPFGVLANASGVSATDAEYRAKASQFFWQHRDDAFIALFNVSPVIRVVVEMFRVGTGVPLKTFPDERAARAWLRGEGIAA
jgi:hypothetical protein